MLINPRKSEVSTNFLTGLHGASHVDMVDMPITLSTGLGMSILKGSMYSLLCYTFCCCMRAAQVLYNKLYVPVGFAIFSVSSY
jgi:hypothetical protein